MSANVELNLANSGCIPGTNYGLGFLYKPVDPNVMKMEDLFKIQTVAGVRKVVSLPETLDLRKDLPPIFNQGSRPTCAACSAVAVKAWQEKKDCGYTGEFSVNYIYFKRENSPNPGMYIQNI